MSAGTTSTGRAGGPSFSAACLRDLLAGWSELNLAAVEIPHARTGEPYTRVWRGIARR